MRGFSNIYMYPIGIMGMLNYAIDRNKYIHVRNCWDGGITFLCRILSNIQLRNVMDALTHEEALRIMIL